MPIIKYKRKIEKYINWIEVYRLANCHFSKYTSTNISYSETVLALNNMCMHNNNIIDIDIIGCGPGRNLLAYPNTTIYELN